MKVKRLSFEERDSLPGWCSCSFGTKVGGKRQDAVRGLGHVGAAGSCSASRRKTIWKASPPPPLPANLTHTVTFWSMVRQLFYTAPRKDKRLLLVARPTPPSQNSGVLRSPKGSLRSSVPNEHDWAQAGRVSPCISQLDAVAMAFLSCWLRISRVRDSRSRSWQVLQTNTGSYSCWSGMGSFRWQQSLQNTLPQFLGTNDKKGLLVYISLFKQLYGDWRVLH